MCALSERRAQALALRGNPVKIPDGPATVISECRLNQPLYEKDVRREDGALICKSGNLLNVKDEASE